MIALSPNQIIYKYQLQYKLGGGCFGQVWLAKDQTLDSLVALKIIDDPNQSIIQQLEEARIGNKLNHPNVCKILYADVVPINSANYAVIAQELHEKGSITNYLNSYNFLNIKSAIKVVQELLCGLEHLHYNNVIHNDIKPSNILINNFGVALLTDYGISSYSPSCVPMAPKNVYVIHEAPETASANPVISFSTDIYQMGLTLYRLVNGVTCLENEYNKLGYIAFNQAKLKGKLITSGSYLGFIPSSIKRIINKCVAPNPNDRYSSALEMRRDIEKLQFRGAWDVNSNGKMIGCGNAYDYIYDIHPKQNGLYDFIANKIKKVSNRQTKISEYCRVNVNKKDLDRIKKEFFKYVIENAL